jgi:hypothetical protein
MGDSYQWIWIILGIVLLHVFCMRLAASPPPPNVRPPQHTDKARGSMGRTQASAAVDDWGVTSEFGLGGSDGRGPASR